MAAPTVPSSILIFGIPLGTFIFNIFTLGISILALCNSRKSIKESKKTVIHQTIFNLQKEYSSHEISYSIRKLWNFKEKYKEKFVDKYMEEFDKLCDIPNNSPVSLENERESIHYQRRLVTTFYQQLAVLYANEIIPEKLIFKLWSWNDLEIIEDILLPIEKRIFIRNHGNEGGFDISVEDLTKLINKSKEFQSNYYNHKNH